MKRLYKLLLLSVLTVSLSAQSSPRKTGTDRAYLGVYTHQVSATKAGLLGYEQPGGVMITRVISGGAADLAGVQAFDYIYGIDGRRTGKDDNFTSLVQQYNPGDQATLHLLRKGKPMRLDIVFGRKSDTTDWQDSKSEGPFLGVSPKESGEGQPGVVVSVVSSSPAQQMGLQHGDKIMAINGYPIIDWVDVTTAINNTPVGSNISIQYEREGKKLKVSGFMSSREDTYASSEDDNSYAYYEANDRSETAFLGIYSNTISKEKAKLLGFDNPYGSYVTGILQNTAAERAGLQAFDYIYGVDEYRTADGQSLTSILKRYSPGQTARLHFVRKGQDRQIQVTFGRREDARRPQVDKCDEPFLGVQSTYTYHEGAGVNVDIIRNSTAQSLGMKDGDVIYAINDYPMIDWVDIATAMDNTKVGQTVTVKWKRQGREMQGSKPVKSYCATKTEQYVAPKEDQPAYAPDWGSHTAPKSDIKVGQIKVSIQDVSRSEAAEVQRRHQLVLMSARALPVEQIKLLPNDKQDKFVLSFDLPSRGPTLVSIYNDSARNVYEYDKGTFSGHFSDEIDLARNGLGTYYLLVKQGDRVNSKRISLQ